MSAQDPEPAPRDRLAEDLRGFGLLGVFAILVILLAGNHPIPFGALLVLAWVRGSRTPWREIGFVRPTSWFRTIAIGVVLGVAFKLLMKSIVMPLLGAPPVNPAFHYLAGNSAALPGAIFSMIFGAGFGEETVFRGFLFERLGKLLGTGTRARTAIVLITSLLFGAAHLSLQGLAGAEQATIVGLVYGTIVVLTGRIWVPMIAHAVFDLTALAIIYWDLEEEVARFFFR